MIFRIGTSRLFRSLFVLALMLAVASASRAQQTQQKQAAPAQVAIDPAVACGCEAAPLPEVLAGVNGVRVTRLELSPEVQTRIANLQRQVIEARKRELDLQINSKLLNDEAKKRGTTSTKLLESEVVSKTQEPTEAEALKFYNENKARIAQTFAEVKTDLIAYLRDMRQRDLAAKFSESLRATAQVKKLVQEVTPPATQADRARILATVNGQNITSAEIEDSLRPLIYSVQEQVYNLRKQDVDLRVNDLLLTQEAQKRKVTTSALLAEEVNSKVPAVTEAEARKFYDENKARINGDFAQIKEQLIQYLRDSAAHNAMLAFADRLRAAAQVETFLVAPTPPVYTIATDDQPSKGNPNASVTLVEFTDYQCPSCASAHPVLERIATEYGDRVKLVVRDYPLSQHPDALKAAEAAEAARAQGKYWEYVALLYQNQSALNADKLKEYASRVGLDRAAFDAALDSGKFSESVHRDMLDGERVGVPGTPTVFVNGRRVTPTTYEGLKEAIETALKSRAE
jgi:protein-disulfide isomerase